MEPAQLRKVDVCVVGLATDRHRVRGPGRSRARVKGSEVAEHEPQRVRRGVDLEVAVHRPVGGKAGHVLRAGAAAADRLVGRSLIPAVDADDRERLARLDEARVERLAAQMLDDPVEGRDVGVGPAALQPVRCRNDLQPRVAVRLDVARQVPEVAARRRVLDLDLPPVVLPRFALDRDPGDRARRSRKRARRDPHLALVADRLDRQPDRRGRGQRLFARVGERRRWRRDQRSTPTRSALHPDGRAWPSPSVDRSRPVEATIPAARAERRELERLGCLAGCGAPRGGRGRPPERDPLAS